MDPDWSGVELWWGDERCVPPDDELSNYGMATRALIDLRGTPPAAVHRMRGELGPEEGAAAYERELRTAFATPSGPPEPVPGRCLDLVLLGMGDNGHTLSLFPHAPTVHERARWVVHDTVDAVPPTRVTLTAPVANAARHALFLVSGTDKAPMLRRVLEGPTDVDALPAQLVAPTHGELTWLVDAAAAAELTRRSA